MARMIERVAGNGMAIAGDGADGRAVLVAGTGLTVFLGQGPYRLTSGEDGANIDLGFDHLDQPE